MVREDIRKQLGLVQVYTGDGKGKTTAALGLALRAIGNGLSVIMIQFMKSPQTYGEYEIAKSLPGLTLLPMGRPSLVTLQHPHKEDVEAAENALAKAKEALVSGHYDMVIMDEINVALHFRLISEEAVIELLKQRPPKVEVVLTGRYASPAIMDVADLVTEMRCLKHPFNRGIPARAGIER